MFHTEKIEDLHKLQQYYKKVEVPSLIWPGIFSLPGCMSAWWEIFGATYETLILAVYEDKKMIGIAPLKRRSYSASFIGDPAVCDYADFIVQPNKEHDFINILISDLIKYGIKTLNLETLRPNSAALRGLNSIVPGHSLSVTQEKCDISVEMELPASWDDYLLTMDSRQRHDIERKQRKLLQAGEPNFVVLKDSEVQAPELEIFLDMMTASRRDKSFFMTSEMRVYFHKLVHALADYGVVRLGYLWLGKMKVAGILYFDYNDRIYLYNSGYNPDYTELSVGLISKLSCIKEAINNKKKVFDFLKGAEIYKTRLGGHEIPLSTCRLELN